VGEFLADGVVVGLVGRGVVLVAHNALVAAYVAAKGFFERQIYGFEIAIGYCDKGGLVFFECFDKQTNGFSFFDIENCFYSFGQ
jgi:hypothetical protein